MNTPPTWQSWLTAAQVARLFAEQGKPVTDRHVRRWISDVDPADVRTSGNVREVRLSALRLRMCTSMVEVLDMDDEEVTAILNDGADVPEEPLEPKDAADIDGHTDTDMKADIVLYEEPTFPSWERARTLPDMTPITLPIDLAELFPAEPAPAYCRDWQRDRWTVFLQGLWSCAVMLVRILLMLFNAFVWVAERACGVPRAEQADVYEVDRWQSVSAQPNVLTRRRR